MIEILQKGMLTTVQDAGRRGYQSAGVPVCGAMDAHGLALANVLAGNDIGEAALEITGIGPEIAFLTGNIFAVCGGDFDMRLNGTAIEANQAYFAARGSVLKIGGAKKGFRAYIAFCGGLDLPMIMGSKSTCLTAGFGGLEGRALEKGDKIGFCSLQAWLPSLERRKCEYSVAQSPSLRVVLGPQDDYFSQAGIDTFLGGEYTITAESNRMGYRTKGPAIDFAPGFGPNIISDGIALGAVQVPNGTPIIMTADRQTAGGYAKIAHVITADMPALAQMKPGDTVAFCQISAQEARRAARDRARKIRSLAYELDWSATSR